MTRPDDLRTLGGIVFFARTAYVEEANEVLAAWNFALAPSQHCSSSDSDLLREIDRVVSADRYALHP